MIQLHFKCLRSAIIAHVIEASNLMTNQWFHITRIHNSGEVIGSQNVVRLVALELATCLHSSTSVCGLYCSKLLNMSLISFIHEKRDLFNFQWFCFYFCFETESHYVTQAGLEVTIILPGLQECTTTANLRLSF